MRVKLSGVMVFLVLIFISFSPIILAEDQAINYDERTIETEHFIIQYQEGALSIARDVAQIAEKVYLNATEFIMHTPSEKLLVYANHTVEPVYDKWIFTRHYFGSRGYGGGGVIQLFYPPFWCQESLGSTSYTAKEYTFAHELNHVLLFESMPNMVYILPRWYYEGLATFYPRDIYAGTENEFTKYLLYRVIEEDRLLDIDEMVGRPATEEEFSLPYIEGYSIMKYIYSNYGYGKLQDFILNFRTWSSGEMTTTNLQRIFYATFNMTLNEFEDEWMEWLKNDFIKEPPEIQEIQGTKLTDSNFTMIPSSWSQKGILYVDGTNGSLDIYLMDENATTISSLTFDNGTDADAVFSPDGEKIAFTSLRNGTYDIYLMDSDGSDIARLTNDTHINVAPSWSPDGEKIAFTSDRDGNYDIFEIELATGDTIPLVQSRYNDGAPTYSPDGRELAFSSNMSGNFSIHILDIETKEIRRISIGDDANDYFPSWSPDGRYIAFVRYASSSGLIIYDLDKDEETILFEHDIWNAIMVSVPVWSPDGKELCLTISEWRSPVESVNNIFIFEVREESISMSLIMMTIILAVAVLLVVQSLRIIKGRKM